MKTKFWMLGVAVAALTSCTQNEVVDVPDSRVIGFDTFVGKNTRAANLIQQAGPEATTTKDNMYQFWAFGFEGETSLFDGTDENAKVYWNATNNGFTYDNHKTWNLNENYNFAAYSNGNERINTDGAVTYEMLSGDGESGSKLTFTNYTVGDNDLLAAIVPPIKVDDTGSNIAPVPLTFQHMLSCVRISLRNSSSALYLKFDDITFTGVFTDNCVYQINNNTKSCVWSNTTAATQTAATGTYTFDAPDGYLTPGATLNMLVFVIPQSNQNHGITITANTYEKNGDDYTSTSVNNYSTTLAITDTDGEAPDHTTWQPGYQYQYSAEIAGSVHYIHFSVSVDDWNTKQETLPTTSTTVES